MKNSGFGGDKYYLVKGHTTMATVAQLKQMIEEAQSSLNDAANATDARRAENILNGINPASDFTYQGLSRTELNYRVQLQRYQSILEQAQQEESAIAVAQTAIGNPTAGTAEGPTQQGDQPAPQTQKTPESQSDTRIVGTAYDDDGNLNPGWTLDEFNNPVKTDVNFVEPATQASAAQSRAAAAAPQPVAFSSAPDWRFRIKLAPESNYLYNAPDPGILAPLKGKGVIFPYTPTISVAYTAKYDTNAIAHSNYNVYTYQGSAVENITVTGDFTAQDITEANYMLAVIHFCRSATKMFYGQDKFRGTPPPLLYLSGLGEYQFDNHPVVLTNFTYTLPSDVDYINAYPNGGTTGINGASLTPFQQPGFGRELGAFGGAINNVLRLFGAGLTTRGTPTSQSATPSYKSSNTTRVPTKLSISLTFNPMITRYAVSNKFSLTDYANGKLLQGSKNPGNGGGMW
jgi:hypothetical protein